jgi:hypothetical protein
VAGQRLKRDNPRLLRCFLFARFQRRDHPIYLAARGRIYPGFASQGYRRDDELIKRTSALEPRFRLKTTFCLKN